MHDDLLTNESQIAESDAQGCEGDTEFLEVQLRVLLTPKANQGHVDKDLTLEGSHFGPLTWAFGGGDGIRTHGLYIANIWLSAF